MKMKSLSVSSLRLAAQCTNVYYARQESNNASIPSGNSHNPDTDGAKSGAVLDGTESPVVSVLGKLAVNLSPDECAALIELLRRRH